MKGSWLVIGLIGSRLGLLLLVLLRFLLAVGLLVLVGGSRRDFILGCPLAASALG